MTHILLTLAAVVGFAEDDSPRPEMLKSPLDVKIALDNPEVVKLDARSKEAYLKSHIPGAVWVDVEAWQEKSLSEGGLQDEKWFAEQFGNLGIGDDSRVVVYGDEVKTTARVWWLLRYGGVHHVSLLNGGYAAWEKAEFPATGSVDEKDLGLPNQAAEFRPAFDKDRLIELEELLSAQKAGSIQVVDARSSGEHAGTEGKGDRKGHLPGAANLNWEDLLQEDGRFKSNADILAMLSDRGLTSEQTLVTHCWSGGRASAAAFALEMVGMPKVKNFYCGFSQYHKDDRAEVVTPKSGEEK